MTSGQLALLCLLGLTFTLKGVTSQARCSVPEWPSGIDGENPLQLHAGKVLLVALMQGYCRYCWIQAHNLERLRDHLHNRGFSDVEMILINGGGALSRINNETYAQYTNLTVYQDTANNTLFNLFGGEKDDFIIYDRCGQRVARLTRRFSYLGHTYTERALRAIHRGFSWCSCSLDPQTSRTRRSANNWMVPLANN
ncbi:hypothetical protein EGW08_000865 [Elysia chlorotica]|uniref:Selenoprotein P N-terminal domain-containing protein n=1 Tax=Elysia chlorotica TaxID=188477 RepID=A0A433UC21_ELYCH|nr:hypothetical protein EGW08_000865 [Elysia chlorotica]